MLSIIQFRITQTNASLMAGKAGSFQRLHRFPVETSDALPSKIGA